MQAVLGTTLLCVGMICCVQQTSASNALGKKFLDGLKADKDGASIINGLSSLCSPTQPLLGIL
eukprot:SAG31_NODE_2435_length_5703_cov_2.125446_6_plen_63_part_00